MKRGWRSGAILTAVLGAHAAAPAQAALCRTHEPCSAQAACSCLAPARSAGWVYYYLDLPVEQGNVVHCTLSRVGPAILQVLPGAGQAPAGVVLHWQACCDFAPSTLVVDARAMHDAAGTLVIKYGRAPSDYPVGVQMRCTLANTPHEA